MLPVLLALLPPFGTVIGTSPARNELELRVIGWPAFSNGKIFRRCDGQLVAVGPVSHQ